MGGVAKEKKVSLIPFDRKIEFQDRSSRSWEVVRGREGCLGFGHGGGNITVELKAAAKKRALLTFSGKFRLITSLVANKSSKLT